MPAAELKAARLRAGLTQKGMQEALGMPWRTAQNREAGVRTCPDWVERLVIAELDRIAQQKGNGNQAWISTPFAVAFCRAQHCRM